MSKIFLRLTANVVEVDGQGSLVTLSKIKKTVRFPFVPVPGMETVIDGEPYTLHNIEFDSENWDKSEDKFLVTSGTYTINVEDLQARLDNGWQEEDG